ncbi:general stress protein [Kocuria rhizophila]|uniref:general stress protein n=1 Tax=Kocuria TaxID=57493 RepID=UPI0002E20DC4|nr:general stress protein [Kocuria rhizophila]MDA4828257.1 hypothetical protein [Kocuria rhizophila]
MSTPNRAPSQLSIAPEMPRGEVVGRYRTYAEAQKAVDYMSDEHFPVAMVSIIGSDLKSVEQVTGRLSYPRVALQGALNGIFFGAFLGLILTMFGGPEMAASIVPTMLLGGAFFMLMATITYAMSRGKRDFTSTSRIVAGSYEVLAAPEVAGQARQVLGGMQGGPGPRPQGPGQYGGAPVGARGQGGAPQAQQWAPGSSQHPGAGHPQGGQQQTGPQQGPAAGRPHPAAQGGSSAQGADPSQAAPQQESTRSAAFPDLPDGRPQYGIRVEPEQDERSAPWTQTGGPTGQNSAAGQDYAAGQDSPSGQDTHGAPGPAAPEDRR